MSAKTTILVVDDNRSAADGLGMVLERHGYAVEVRYSGEAAIARLQEGGIDVVVTDLRMEPVDGLAVLDCARALPIPAEVLVLTGYGTVDDAVRAMRRGARDFLTKPVTADQVVEQLRQLQGAGLHIRVQDGVSAAARELARQIEVVAAADATVLLSGEPGSGRNQVARQVHEQSPAGGRPLAVIPHPSHLARVDLAAVGGLYFPNVDLLDPRDQVQLVQALDSMDPDTAPRVIASAHAEWGEQAALDPSVQELYYRLAVLEVVVPPLRERPDDIEPLLTGWLAARAQDRGVDPPAPNGEQLKALRLHAWPGNLRELAAVVERALVFGNAAFDIQVHMKSMPGERLPELIEGFSLQQYLEEVERTLLVRAIDQTGMDRTHMSRILGVERNTLRYKLNKYGLLDRS
ncbi:MAG: sigma-54-dependent Fis family transcriptional regulator [Alphaproteobacteria bacterium]|nr:sigma-54-dependent Fis family transcriptional regulator [Alphaproteobacteria bacterium]